MPWKTSWILSQLREDHLLLRDLLEWLRSASRNDACVFRYGACVRDGETGFCKQLTTASDGPAVSHLSFHSTSPRTRSSTYAGQCDYDLPVLRR